MLYLFYNILILIKLNIFILFYTNFLSILLSEPINLEQLVCVK